MAYNKSEKAILKTITYSDIFNSPVLESELWRFLISERRIEKEDFERSILRLSSKIIHKDGMYCLSGREENIARRKMYLPEAAKKIRLAKHAAYVLSHIPTVSFIGLSGGAAVGNVREDDDVDFFIITKKNTLYMTRFFVLVMLEALGLRRKRNDSNPADKICVNFLIDETALIWPIKSRDIYTAREIVQVKPLFERNGMYRKFLSSNEWIKAFFPNADPHRVAFTEPSSYFTIAVFSRIIILLPMEFVMKVFQKSLIKRSRTREFVSNHVLAFHPHDYRKQTLRDFEKKLKGLGIATLRSR
jgi:hypothetical protein